jgi:rhodanese-related sulfurtransferase
MSDSGVPQVTPEDAAARADDGALLLDVREDDEWIAGHAPDARHLPLGRLQQEQQSLARDRPIVAVCRVGGRSERAAVALRAAGYDVVNLAGGMRAWAAAGQAVVTDDGGPGQVI